LQQESIVTASNIMAVLIIVFLTLTENEVLTLQEPQAKRYEDNIVLTETVSIRI
jgi:hypothetical protein